MRRLPFGLRDKVDEKLDEPLDVGIIEEVPEAKPTTWVSPLVVVPKADGKDIRVWVDMGGQTRRSYGRDTLLRP